MGSGRGTAPGSWTGPSIFQVEGIGKSVVYVIDRSVSMGPFLKAAKRELLASLEQLPEEVRFQVILYNRHAEPLRLRGRTDLAPATAANKRETARLLESLPAAGSTDHLAGLRRALALRPEVSFFVTDADDLTAQQIAAVTQLNRSRTAIHTIELSRSSRGPHPDGPLALLARHNRGTYRRVSLGGGP